MGALPDRRSVLAWVLVLPWAVWVLVRVAGLEAGYPWVALVAFTPYVLPLALLAGAAAALLRRALPAAVAVACVLVLAWLLAPRALGGSEPSSGPTLRVMTHNLLRGGTPAGPLVALAREQRVQVLVLQELTPDAVRALRAAGLQDRMPYRTGYAGAGAGEVALYSTVPLRELPARAAGGVAMAAAELELDGAAPAQVVGLHTPAPFSAANTARWGSGLRALPAAPPTGPVRLLVGDFNATLDHAAFRELLGRGYRDAAAVVGAGLRPTWRGGRAPWLTIDHVLVPERVAVRSVSVHRLPVSDHRALVAELRLPAG